MTQTVSPKAFASYSWTSNEHKELVRSWADRLLSDGVQVVIDVYDLKEGHDKHAFMEKSVRDLSVSHVLMVCDRAYAEKADARAAGVGTETQLISKEVYEKVEQSKFIPIFCEMDEKGQPYLPAYLSSRIGIDFSTPEKVNANWEQLVRLLHGQPRFVKPQVGPAPAYLKETDGTPPSVARARFEDLRQAVIAGRPNVPMYRRVFLGACYAHIDALRTRSHVGGDPADRIIDTFRALKPVRDLIVDWVLLEGGGSASGDFAQALIDVLEELIELKSRPKEITNWDSSYFQSHELFVYETFLYVVASLIKAKMYPTLHEVFASHYLRATTDRGGKSDFETYACFYAHAEILQRKLAPEGQTLYSPAAALVKLQAQRTDIKFEDLMEADMLATFVGWATGNYWYPQLMYYAGHYQQFPLFLRATQRRHFAALATITGIADANALRDAVTKGYEAANVRQWPNFWGHNFLQTVNLERLDTL